MAGIDEGEIRVCPNHPDYQVPLIWTFSFPGAEYWCPYCGYTGGVMGGGGSVEVRTLELNEREKKYNELSEEYLHAKGVECCVGLMWEGKEIHPDDLPDAEKDRLDKIRREWKYQVKV